MTRNMASHLGIGLIDGIISQACLDRPNHQSVPSSHFLFRLAPRPIERRLDWVFYKTEMKIWAVWAVRAVRKKKWI